ncbi:MAG: RNA polymerase sigma factor [Woeseiaceae bacterium]|nr:RNA polymerase sigma factor [Woeseiaceae bacterium]
MKYDPSLLKAAKAGDPTAMSALLEIVQPDIRRYARYRCSRASAIDDVIQETLIIVNRKMSSVNNLEAFGGWLVRIVTRVCLLPALQLMRATESLVTIDNNIDYSTRSDEDLRIDISKAIESLPEQYRSVIVMRDIEELSIGEMAERLGITRAATKSRLHRARGMVREYLVEGGHER